MNRPTYVLTLMIVAFGVPATAQDQAPADAEPGAPPEVTSPEEMNRKASYAIGLQMGGSFKYQEFDVDIEALVQGIQDGVAGAAPRFAADEIQAALDASRQAANAAIAARNRKLGEAFLAANAKRQGVFTLASGLQYEVLESGDGPTPTADDRVTVSFRSTRVDGTEIDSTADETPTHAVSDLVAGWAEAIVRMPVGSRWRLFVPSDLAHGDRGSGRVGPGETTIFDIQLLAIAEPDASATAAEGGD